MILAALTLGVNASVLAQSETFKAFKVDLSMGPTLATGEKGSVSLVVAMEPKFAINDKITLGVRLEGALRTYDSLEDEYSGSYMATADYYLSTNGLRPFFGTGAGIMSVTAFSEEENDGTIEKDKFAFMPRAGFETGHFRLALEYNLAPKVDGFSSNYASLKFGFFLGGGRK